MHESDGLISVTALHSQAMHVSTLAAWTMFPSFPPAATDVAGAATITAAGAVAVACVAGAGLVLLLQHLLPWPQQTWRHVWGSAHVGQAGIHTCIVWDLLNLIEHVRQGTAERGAQCHGEHHGC